LFTCRNRYADGDKCAVPLSALVERFVQPSKVRGLSNGGYFVCPNHCSHGYQINRLPPCAQSQNRTILTVRFRRQCRLATTVLLGLALARSARALPPPPGNISACQHDDLGVANHKVTSK
jgi:hypothetical protein